MITAAQLKTVTDALEARTSVRTGNENPLGWWRRIALALEEGAGVSSTGNNTVTGYMTRAAVAAEAKWGGSGAEENGNRAGLLKRIVDAMELNAGVGSGSLTNRFTTRASLVAFDTAAMTSLKASSAALAIYDPSSRSSMGQGLTDTSTAVSANDPVGFVRNLKPSATAYNLTASDPARRPLNTSGLTFDTSNDWLEFAQPSAGAMPASATILFLVKGVTVTAPFINDGSSVGVTGQSGVGADGGGSAAGTVLVDGVARAFRDDVFTAACNGAFHTIEHAGANYSAFTSIRFNGYPGLQFGGIVVPVAILNTAAGDYAAALASARTVASEIRTRLGL